MIKIVICFSSSDCEIQRNPFVLFVFLLRNCNSKSIVMIRLAIFWIFSILFSIEARAPDFSGEHHWWRELLRPTTMPKMVLFLLAYFQIRDSAYVIRIVLCELRAIVCELIAICYRTSHNLLTSQTFDCGSATLRTFSFLNIISICILRYRGQSMYIE